jgi:excisionase family DNA binding protein
VSTTATERYFSLGEVADRLGVSDQTVRRWVKAGELPAYKPGKEWRIKDSDLDSFLETRSFPKVQAPLPPPEASHEEPSEGERHEREEYAEALMSLWAEEGEHLEEEIKSSPEGFPLQRAKLFAMAHGLAQVSYEEIASTRQPPEPLREAKEQLDAMSRRIGALWNQTMHPASAEMHRQFKEFVQRQADALREREEIGEEGAQDTDTRSAG